MAENELRLEWPLRGVHKGTSHRKRPSLTTQSARNVRNFDTGEGRARGGQRSGISKIYTAPPVGTPQYEIELDSLVATKVYFNSGADFSAGTYKITYKEGAWDPGDAFEWTITNCYIYSDDVEQARFRGSATTYTTQAMCEAAHAGDFFIIEHTSGTIGMNIVDDPYEDNTNGTPGPTFIIEELSDDVGNPIRMLASASTTSAAGTYEGTVTDDFNRQDTPAAAVVSEGLGDPWTMYTWTRPAYQGFTTRLRIKYEACVAPGKEVASASVWGSLDVSQVIPYSVQIDPVYALYQSSLTKHYTGQYPRKTWIFLRLDDDSPDPYTGGLLCCITNYSATTPRRWQPRLLEFSSGGLLFDSDNDPGNDPYDYVETASPFTREPVTFRVTVLGNRVTGELRSTSSEDSQWLPLFQRTCGAPAGSTVGIGMLNTSGDMLAMADNFMIRGTQISGVPEIQRTSLIAISDGKIYEEISAADNQGYRFSLVEGDSASVATGHSVVGIEHMQRLVMLDYDTARVLGEDGTIGGANHDTLTATGVSDWTSYSIDADTDVCTIYGSASPGPDEGTYQITEIAEDGITIGTNLSADGTCYYRIERGAKLYDSGAVSLLFATTGSTPPSCQIGCNWRGRLVMARSNYDTHNWWMSRQEDIYDFDYSQTDAQAAVSGNNASLGKAKDPVMALAPFSDDYLLFGCRASLWLMRGDPMQGGSLDNVTDRTGIVDAFAWCPGPTGEIYFLGQSGLYMLRARWAEPKPLSQSRLPRDLAGINTANYEVRLDYDWRQEGISIFITPRQTGVAKVWFYDIRLDAFWEDAIPTNFGPTALFAYNADTMDRRFLLMGGRDGYIRAYDPTARTDDGAAITSFCSFPTVMLSKSNLGSGILNRLDVVLSDDTDSLGYEMKVGTGHQGANTNDALFNGTWYGGGVQKSSRMRVRGRSMTLKLSNSTLGHTWAVDELAGSVVPAGRRRV